MNVAMKSECSEGGVVESIWMGPALHFAIYKWLVTQPYVSRTLSGLDYFFETSEFHLCSITITAINYGLENRFQFGFLEDIFIINKSCNEEVLILRELLMWVVSF